MLVRAVCALLCFAAVNGNAQEPAILGRARVDPRRDIDFHAYVSPETLYVGQQATYQVAVFLDAVTRERLPRNPEFLPPELRGIIAYELLLRQSYPIRTIAGRQYITYVFQKALFPLASGKLSVPSPQLSYSMRLTTSYFSREEGHIVRAESLSIVVKPLPDEGRPSDFTGAVGVLKSLVKLDTTSARVGDPLVLTLRVQGTGNVKLLPRPTLEVEWASAVPGTERLQVDSSGALLHGAKEFDWILTPSREGEVTTPAVRYSYFNPSTRKYEIAEAAPVTLNVRSGSLAAPDSGEQTNITLPLRSHDVGAVPPLPNEHWLWWVWFVVLPIPAAVLSIRATPRTARKTAPIESLRSLKRSNVLAPASKGTAAVATVPATARDVRRLLLSSLASRLEIAPDIINERKRTQRALLRRGVTRETTRDVLEKLSELDVAAFAWSSALASETSDAIVKANTELTPSGGRRTIEPVVNADVGSLTAQALALYDRVDREALPQRNTLPRKSRLGSGKSVSIILLACAVAAAPIVRAQGSGGAWQNATAAYKNRSFLEASENFLQIAVASPRDADALVNWGIASWAAGDTVSSVLAWQRAVRLDPLAADLREKLLLLPSGARDGIAYVPLVPVAALAYAGLAAWAVGWIILAWLFWRRRQVRQPLPAMRIVATLAIATGAACSLASAWGQRQLESDKLSVVVRPETMRAAPASDADALGGAATGDIVRVDQLQHDWAHVTHADGREGWLPVDHITPLGDGTQ